MRLYRPSQWIATRKRPILSVGWHLQTPRRLHLCISIISITSQCFWKIHLRRVAIGPALISPSRLATKADFASESTAVKYDCRIRKAPSQQSVDLQASIRAIPQYSDQVARASKRAGVGKSIHFVLPCDSHNLNTSMTLCLSIALHDRV